MQKEEKDKAKKAVLEAEWKKVITEEKAWLKSIAEQIVEEKKDVYLYKVIKRGENALLLEVKTTGCYGKEYRLCGYDVIRRDIRRPQIYMGKAYDAAEMFPGDNSFAYWCFRFTPLADALAKAEKRFNALESGEEEEELTVATKIVTEIAAVENAEIAADKKPAKKEKAEKKEAKEKKI